jgi:hypothetical protein
VTCAGKFAYTRKCSASADEVKLQDIAEPEA